MSDTFPLPSWTPSYQDIFDAVLVVADEKNLPRDMLLGLCFAESGEGLQSFDRWHRWTVEAMTYIAAQNRQGLADILQRCAAVPTNDISFGPCHQTWRWSREYNGNPYDLDAILAFRALYISDHGHALRVAAGQLAGHWAKHGPDKVEAMSRYNKPDGTATAGVRKRYADMLALAQSKLQETPVPPSTIIYEPYPDPSPAGTFSGTPRGIVLHGSRSGKAGNSQMAEYQGTANWEINNPDGLGWHVTIADNRVAEHIDVRQWGWHAKAASPHYLGVEFAQPTVDTPITDAQVAALADWIKTRVTPVWGDLGFHFPSHAEVDQEFNQNQGKSDIYPLADPRLDVLRNRLYALLGAPGWEPVPEPEPPPPVDLRAELLAIVATPDERLALAGVKAKLRELLDRTA